ncbi:MAG: CRISPR system precrRNA processing endoribonuclease RAMP protein Cas6 [Bryobacterales bacterium]|nr:CRISPR system precrRNA processing endoribonuclease RAMP protein Cas6 [Bryobacteraceae bacterium]MDW8354840.1 CRISPR system precrRNA processing endoribonuclease RAMP protein Cas6 [Bryobacterales bacterium]
MSVSSTALSFSLYAFRFSFRAAESLYFPPGKSGNIVRGAFGSVFRKLACVPECTDARTCQLRETCPYARIFEPSAIGRGPSGLADPPRPFVFRAAHLDGRAVRPGERFHFDAHIFDLKDPALAYFVLSFAQLAHEGLGPGRGRAELERVDQLGADREPRVEVFDGRTFVIHGALPPMELDLRPRPEPVCRLRVLFVTPTELKEGGEMVLRPEFGVLFARIRDRLSTLRALYGPGPLEMDFKAMGQRAAQVRLARSALRWTETTRRSGKSGQVHPFGGFTGEAEYEGDLAEFLPFLEAAQWTGVGRQTVWGKGEMRVLREVSGLLPRGGMRPSA